MPEAKIMPTHIVTVAGIIENKQQEILLVKNYHGGWVFPGGQVEVGENLVDALKREMLEESGIEIQIDNLFCISSNTCTYPGYDGVKMVPTKVMFDFIGKPIGGKIHTSEENSETKWVSRENVLEYIEAPAIIERYKTYLSYEKAVTYIEYVTKPKFEVKLKISI